MKTYAQKPAEVQRRWYLVDASDRPLGRLATVVAGLLTGKRKASFTPHVDGGDFVIVINASKISLSGKKADQKIYYSHSGYPGSLKQITAGKLRETRPELLIEKAVYGMLAKNKLRAGRLIRLKIYPEAEHKHEAQQPQAYKLGTK